MNCEVNRETMTDLRRGSLFDIFTSVDHEIVRRALAGLTQAETMVVRMRFWEKRSMTEIASILDLGQREVEGHLLAAFSKLKNVCLANPKFSRSSQRANLGFMKNAA